MTTTDVMRGATTIAAGLATGEAMPETTAGAPVRISAARVRAVPVRVVPDLAALATTVAGQMVARRRKVVAMTVADRMNRGADRMIQDGATSDAGVTNSHRGLGCVDGRAIKGRRLAAVSKRMPDSLVAHATKARAARGVRLFAPQVWPSTNWRG